MQPLTDFFGAFSGQDWTPTTATVALGAIAAILTAGVAFHQGIASRSNERKLRAREQWWDRFKGVVDDLTSSDEAKRSMALALIEKLTDTSWASREDRKLVVTALAAATSQARKEASSK